MSTSKLEQLRQFTQVVADTGDIEAIKRFQPVDATTNPSLLLKAAEMSQYAKLIEEALKASLQSAQSSQQQLSDCVSRLSVAIGSEIVQIISGRISTEVDSRLSFDSRATIEQARKLINLYEQRGVSKDRVLIKIAATWEGIQAAKVLEKEGINCNLTLLFSFAQAAACAEAGAFLISPFVGRILDWYKAKTGKDAYAPEEDPGVVSVTKIYNYYKQQGFNTVVMGASFRNTEEIEQLAGCDRLTISPALLEALDENAGELPRKLSADNTGEAIARPDPSENSFRWLHNEDAMATEKLAEGIRNFTADQIKLETLLADKAKTLL